MTVRRHLVLAILVYVTLDLSMASMPGAFVFEAGESVETIQMSRVRHVEASGPVLAPARDRKPVIVDDVDVRQPPVPRPVRTAPLRRGDGSPPSTPEPSALSEDSH